MASTLLVLAYIIVIEEKHTALYSVVQWFVHCWYILQGWADKGFRRIGIDNMWTVFDVALYKGFGAFFSLRSGLHDFSMLAFFGCKWNISVRCLIYSERKQHYFSKDWEIIQLQPYRRNLHLYLSTMLNVFLPRTEEENAYFRWLSRAPFCLLQLSIYRICTLTNCICLSIKHISIEFAIEERGIQIKRDKKLKLSSVEVLGVACKICILVLQTYIWRDVQYYSRLRSCVDLLLGIYRMHWT